MVVMTRLPFSSAAGAAPTPFRGADGQFWPDSLKQGFNCPDRRKHGVGPVTIRGEQMENAPPAVALWGPRRYISGSKFP
jgi:hypothetical protein